MYHEPTEELQAKDRDIHRALNSLKEEVEAVDWYHQRVATTGDDTIGDILAHNRDEEIEHACMVLEWLRRNVPAWEENLRTYLFTEAPITEVEEAGGGNGEGGSPGTDGSGLGLGSLK
ncbi:MAG: ferritin-like domain-containing protein [Synergistales bacterium]|nr:ferritin-like domain-containing protein [Synergistales bacterium]